MMHQNSDRLIGLVASLLKRNHLERPTGQPLYQYQLTEGEYAQLKAALQQRSGGSTRVVYDPPFCAAFCLFCAEWFRREYTGGWSWRPIWDVLGYKIDANHRAFVVNKGLQDFWLRPVSQFSDERHSYLGSVFREGGLPFQLLSSVDSRFQDIFKSILAGHDRAKLMGISVVQLVTQLMQSMPEALRDETTIELVAQMADRVMYMVDQYGADQHDDPAQHLDNTQTGWRRLFPIPLDGEAGNRFLSGLLTSATEHARARSKNDEPMTCKQFLLPGDGLRFMAELTLAKSLQIVVKREQLDSARVELHVHEAGKSVGNFGHATVQFTEGKAFIAPRLRFCECKRLEPQQDLYFVIKQKGVVLSAERIEGSQLNYDEVPLTLRNVQNRRQVIGSASASCRAEQLEVLCPASAAIHSSDAEINRQVICDGYQLIGFSGSLQITIDDDSFKVSTLSNVQFADQVTIGGQFLPFQTQTGQPIYLGMPQIECRDLNSQLWVGGERYLGTSSAATFGIQTVKLKSTEGLTLFHKRLAILPSDLTIELAPGGDASEGTLVIRTSHNCFIEVEPIEGLSTKQFKKDGAKHIALKTEAAPPAFVVLGISANLEAPAVRAVVPFPACGALAFDGEGKKLPRKLAVEELLGCRLLLFSGTKGKARYELELLADATVKGASYHWCYEVESTPTEINLYELRSYIRELFAITPDNLDAFVRVRIMGEGASRTYEVRRYAATMVQSEDGITIKGATGAEATPVVMTLTDPKKLPLRLQSKETEGVDTGWFEPPRAGSSPQLVVPEKNSFVNFRAKFIQSAMIVDHPTNTTSLYKAVAEFDPVHNPSAFDHALGAMAVEFLHAGWRYLIDLLENFGYLPLSTFEVWKAVAKHEACLCLLAFRLEQSAELMERLQREFNIRWEWIAIDHWKAAYRTYNGYWQSLGMPATVLRIQSDDKMTELEQFVPLFSKDCRPVIQQELGCVKLLPKSLMNTYAVDWYQSLTQANSHDDHWPTHFFDELVTWYKNLSDKPFDIHIHHGYHRPVVILPVLSAAIAAGKARLGDVLEDSAANRFMLQRIMDFDQAWFLSVYQYALNYFISEA